MLRVVRQRVFRPEFDSLLRVRVGEFDRHFGIEDRKQNDRADDRGGRAAEAVVGERFSFRPIGNAGGPRKLRESSFEAPAAVAQFGRDDFTRQRRTVRRTNVARATRLRDDRREGRGRPGRPRSVCVGSERRENFSGLSRGEFVDGENFHEVMKTRARRE